jgi:hypothetical protein
LTQNKPEAMNGRYKVNKNNENLSWRVKEIVADYQTEFNI